MDRSSGLNIDADASLEDEEEEEGEEEADFACCGESSWRTCRRVLPTSKGVVIMEAMAPESAPAVKLMRKVEVWFSFWSWVCLVGEGEWRVVSLLRIVS